MNRIIEFIKMFMGLPTRKCNKTYKIKHHMEDLSWVVVDMEDFVKNKTVLEQAEAARRLYENDSSY